MKKKTGMYLAIGIIGIALALIAKFLLQDYLSAVSYTHLTLPTILRV
mgnify:CR=1 FL=1